MKPMRNRAMRFAEHAEMLQSLTESRKLQTQTAMLDASIDCIKVIAPNGSLIDMNKSGCEALGVPLGSPFGMQWLPLLPRDVHAAGEAALASARAGAVGRFPGRSELPGEAPRHWDNVLTPVLDEEGHVNAIMCLSRDVTEQRALEEQLRMSKVNLEIEVEARTKELAHLWESAQDLLLVITPAGDIVRANPAWQVVLGYAPDELCGHQLNEFVLADDQAAGTQLLERAAQSLVKPTEIRHIHRDGSVRWVEWIAVPHRDGIYGTGRHITAAKEASEKLKLAEESLHHAQRIETLGRLAGSVAHDFNNVLAVIQHSLMLLRKEGVSEERRERSMGILASTTERGIALTRQLLDFARRSPLRPEFFNAADRVKGLLSMLEMLCGPSMQLELQTQEVDVVYADPSQFDTALVNLVTNARDAMGRTGSISLVVAPSGQAYDTWRRQRHEGDYVAVSVRDRGPGIPASLMDRVFEPFFTTKSPELGNGLGLPQVVGFTERSQGNVSIETDEGIGTKVTMFLPIASDRGESQAAPEMRSS